MISRAALRGSTCACSALSARRKIMAPFGTAILLLLLSLTAALPSRAQLGSVLQSSSAPSAPASSNDPLGRSTPQSTVLGFLHAAQSGDYSIAAQYLQMSPARRQAEGEQLATKLNSVLNDSNAFAGTPIGWSNQADGTPQEGVPLGRQKLGTMSSGDVEADLEVVRVSDP